MDVNEAQRLRQIEGESHRLKPLVAKLCLRGEALKAGIIKTTGACRCKRRCAGRLGRVPAEKAHDLQAAGAETWKLAL